MPLPQSPWRRTVHEDGRAYFWRTDSQERTWDRPADYVPWKEFRTAEGRLYYHNEETNATSWNLPPEYETAAPAQLPASLPPRPVAAAPTFVAGGGTSYPSYGQHRDRDDYDRNDRHDRNDRGDRVDRGERSGMDRHPGYAASAVPFTAQGEVEYATIEEAEAAFFKLLKRVGITAESTWEEAMRAGIKDPQFRAIKDPKDRRVAFDKYGSELRAQEKEREKERVAKLRSDFTQMLRSHPDIKPYSRWKTVKPIIEEETVFRSAKGEDERRQFFEEYVIELRKAHEENQKSNRKRALDELASILHGLELTPFTRWDAVKSAVGENERLQNDPKFSSLVRVDTLNVFQNQMKELERKFNEEKQKEKRLRARKERQNRDRFIALLRSLQSSGKITAGTKWMEVHAAVKDDSAYTAMLGQSGSTPLDLFWDILEEEEHNLRVRKDEVCDVLDEAGIKVDTKTSLDDFLHLLKGHRRTAHVDERDLKLIFKRLVEKSEKRNDEDKHRAEHQERKAIDRLRSVIKHLKPPVLMTDVWEEVRPRLEKFPEFGALTSDDLRRAAFDKHIRRLKEKEEDERDRRRDHRDRRDRSDRDRDHRNGHGDNRRRTRTRSPEPDAYEADRRKAQADRERQYRKSSMGLSPPPSYRRDRDERERYSRGAPRSVYEREREERAAERERSYISRADPRERGSGLDYGEGDSRPGSMRKRRDSDADSIGSRRDAKRSRRDRRSRERSPSSLHKSPAPVPEPAKEDPGLRSGSEEGEIEED